jgi:hypothetical protein
MNFISMGAVGAYGYWRRRALKAEAQLKPVQTVSATDESEPETYVLKPCTKPGCTLTFNHGHI